MRIAASVVVAMAILVGMAALTLQSPLERVADNPPLPDRPPAAPSSPAVVIVSPDEDDAYGEGDSVARLLRQRGIRVEPVRNGDGHRFRTRVRVGPRSQHLLRQVLTLVGRSTAVGPRDEPGVEVDVGADRRAIGNFEGASTEFGPRASCRTRAGGGRFLVCHVDGGRHVVRVRRDGCFASRLAAAQESNADIECDGPA